MHSTTSVPPIRSLKNPDLDAAVNLSVEAGWNQVRADWERLLTLSPNGCFGCWRKGELVATCTVISYGGEICWIGMMLVRQSHRRRGLGRAMFERALEVADSSVIGLDATDYGRPLYLQYAFEDIAPLTRWRGRIQIPPAVERSANVELEKILEIDARLTRVDRARLLRRLARDGKVLVDTAGGSYAFLRPGRQAWQMGPIVASDPGALVELLSIASIYTAQDDIVVDVVGPESRVPDIPRVLTEVGLRPHRILARMTTRPSASYFCHASVIAAAGLELG